MLVEEPGGNNPYHRVCGNSYQEADRSAYLTGYEQHNEYLQWRGFYACRVYYDYTGKNSSVMCDLEPYAHKAKVLPLD